MVEHRGPLEYELMTRAHYTLDDLGGGLSWPALVSFIQYLPPGALEEDRELRAWFGGQYTADLLALIADINRGVGQRDSHGRTVQPMKRPSDKYTKPKSKKHVGSGAIPVAAFDDWYYRKG